VRLQRAHAELRGPGESLAVIVFGLHYCQRLASCCNVAEEAQGIRLVAAFLMRTGEREGLRSKGLRLLQVAGHHLRFSERETTVHLKASCAHDSGLFQRLCEQRHGVGDAPA
jgi:hypothetical protein